MRKGQAFAAMKLAIGAVFALTLLTLVYFLSQNISAPTTAYLESKDMISQALNAQGQCIGRALVPYKVGEILTPSVYKASLGLTGAVTVSAPARMISDNGPFSTNLPCCSVTNAFKGAISVKCTDVNPASKSCDIYLGVADCSIS